MRKQHTPKCKVYIADRSPDSPQDDVVCDCDGYHTFEELYEHRIVLFIALCKIVHQEFWDGLVWRSKLHHDGTSYDGWFIMGIGREKGKQISYHLPVSKWDDTEFAQTLDRAPEWDGHTSDDVLERLKAI